MSWFRSTGMCWFHSCVYFYQLGGMSWFQFYVCDGMSWIGSAQLFHRNGELISHMGVWVYCSLYHTRKCARALHRDSKNRSTVVNHTSWHFSILDKNRSTGVNHTSWHFSILETSSPPPLVHSTTWRPLPSSRYGNRANNEKWIWCSKGASMWIDMINLNC
jgi:hypothetical protein